MKGSVQFNTTLDNISRRFVYRQSADTRNGYADIRELCADVEQARSDLSILDAKESSFPRNTEYWIRLLNDFTSYCEDWPLDVQDEASLYKCANTFQSFEPGIVQRSSAFTQTQQTRILSIALRARQVTLEPVLTSIIDAMGSTMSL